MHCHRRRRGATRDVVLGVIAVALLGFGIWYYWTHSGGYEAAPTDPSSYVYFKCGACNETFHLNGREQDELMKKRGFKTGEDGRTNYFKCKKCGEFKAVVLNASSQPGIPPAK